MTTQRVHAFVALAAVALALAGCQGSQEPGAEESATPSGVANAPAPDGKPGISASDGRLILPAVPGRPGVAYFSVKNATTAPVELASVHIDGVGEAEMHQTAGGTMTPVDKVEIGPGAEISFAPGSLHVMTFQIDPKLKPGDATELTLTFADRDKTSIPLKIEALGGDMGGMHH